MKTHRGLYPLNFTASWVVCISYEGASGQRGIEQGESDRRDLTSMNAAIGIGVADEALSLLHVSAHKCCSCFHHKHLSLLSAAEEDVWRRKCSTDRVKRSLVTPDGYRGNLKFHILNKTKVQNLNINYGLSQTSVIHVREELQTSQQHNIQQANRINTSHSYR